MPLTLMNAPHAAYTGSLDALFPEGRIRLAEISLYNWGTFAGLHTGRIDPGGTLITGHTGAGKSTFADALQALLLRPMETRFNAAAAQGDSKDRSVVTYVRGRLGSTEDSNGRVAGKYKRPSHAFSGLRALYRTDLGNEITIAALFWMNTEDASVGDMSRGYVVAHRNIDLKEILTLTRDESGIRWDLLAAHCKGMSDVHCTRDFGAYSEWYRNALWLEDPKAPALLARAMGLKRVNDLTLLVRDLVLEEPKTRDKGIKAILEFQSLNAIHDELVTSRRRRDHLQKLPLLAVDRNLELIEREKHLADSRALPIWHALQVLGLIDQLIAEQGLEIQGLEQRRVDAIAAESVAQERHIDAVSDYRAAGGDDLDRQEQNLARAQEVLRDAATNRSTLMKVLQGVGIQSSEQGWTEEGLTKLKIEIRRRAGHIDAEIKGYKDQLATALVEHKLVSTQITTLGSELQELEKKGDTNIDPDYLRLRRKLSESTGIPIADLPFVGEMIDVKERERHWQGAIEKALGFRRLRMVIHEYHRSDVRAYLDTNHLGKRVGIEVATAFTGVTAFRTDSFLKKLEWGTGHHRDWLKRYLSEATLDCLANRDEMDNRSFSMTISGMIQYKLGSYDKDDTYDVNDVDRWCLGFSNEGRKGRLLSEITRLLQQRHASKKGEEEIDAKITMAQRFEEQSNSVLGFEWAAIDIEGCRARARTIEERIASIRASRVDLTKAQQAMEESREVLKAATAASHQTSENLAVEQSKLRENLKIREVHAPRSVGAIPEAARDRLQARFKSLVREDLARESDAHIARTEAVQKLLTSSGASISIFDRTLGEIMVSYKTIFLGAAEELPLRQQRDQDAMAFGRIVEEWEAHFKDLDEGKLPDLVNRFQDSLNRQTAQSLTIINQAIKAQSEQIHTRIEQINTVLERTETTKGTRLSLVSTGLSDDSVKRFDAKLGEAIRMAASSDPEAHFKALDELVKMLEKATDASTRHNVEFRGQLDARYRMTFAIREWRSPAGTPVDCAKNLRETVFTHRDTKGKSGGEKEGFSGFVVASALAYVLTPTSAGRPSYCSVFLDEAFSNTSDEPAKRVLKVFKDLGLHITLITPFKNVELARSAVNSALVVEIDDESESHLSEVTWEEIDRQRIADGNDLLRAEADRLQVSYAPAGMPII